LTSQKGCPVRGRCLNKMFTREERLGNGSAGN
jgi:hypothetical protein